MKLPTCEIDREAPLTPFERVCSGLALLSPFLGLLLAVTLVGCRAFYENSGSKVNVGTLTAPVEVSDSSDAVTVRALYSMDGAAVWTAKDSLVKITYRNIYTNNYFAIVETQGEQDLSVEIEPLDTTGAGETNVSASASVPTTPQPVAISSGPSTATSTSAQPSEN